MPSTKQPSELIAERHAWVAKMNAVVCRRDRAEREKHVLKEAVTRWTHNERRKKATKKEPHGHYVYAWHDSRGVFYIGRGTGKRYLECHGDYPSEIRRKQAGCSFTARIIRDNLTREGAVLVESTLIAYLAPACNQSNGPSRQEIPPLTYDQPLAGESHD